MTSSSSIDKLKAHLLATIAGRGLPADWVGGMKQEAKVLSAARELQHAWTGSCNNKEAKDMCAGSWRAVYSTSEILRSISNLQGGPLSDYYETIKDDVIHTAAPTRVMMYFLLMLVTLPVQLTIAGQLHVGVLGGMLICWVTSAILESISFTGLFVSRRRGFDIDSHLIASSTLERDVICVVASRLGFDRTLSNPMDEFCHKFDTSDGAKDPLKPSFFLGWRFIPKYVAVHVLSPSKGLERKEHVLFVDNEIRVMFGGDVSSLDGTVAQYLTVYVKV